MSGSIQRNTHVSTAVTSSNFNNLRKIDKITGTNVSLEGLSPTELNRKVSDMKKMTLPDRILFLRQLDAQAKKGNVNAIQAQIDILNSGSLSKLAGEACEKIVDEALAASRRREPDLGRALAVSDYILHLGVTKGKNAKLGLEIRKVFGESTEQLQKELQVKKNAFAGSRNSSLSRTEISSLESKIGDIKGYIMDMHQQLCAINKTANSDIILELRDYLLEMKRNDSVSSQYDSSDSRKTINFTTESPKEQKAQTDDRGKTARKGFFSGFSFAKLFRSIPLPSFRWPSLPSWSSFRLPSITWPSFSLPSFSRNNAYQVVTMSPDQEFFPVSNSVEKPKLSPFVTSGDYVPPVKQHETQSVTVTDSDFAQVNLDIEESSRSDTTQEDNVTILRKPTQREYVDGDQQAFFS